MQLDKSKLARCGSRPRSNSPSSTAIQISRSSTIRFTGRRKPQVDEAQRQLDHASVHAPFSGIVTQVDALQPGTYLVSQTAALTGAGAIALVSTDHMWIAAQMKETDLTYVKPGNHVDVTVDTYPGQVWSGTLRASVLPAARNSRSCRRRNRAATGLRSSSGFRCGSRSTRKPGAPVLRSGMSVYVSIDTGHRRSLTRSVLSIRNGIP